MTDLDKSVHEALQSTAELSLRAGADIGAQDAQAEIARLREVNARLVEALGSLSQWRVKADEYDADMGNDHRTYCEDVELMENVARAALTEAGKGEG